MQFLFFCYLFVFLLFSHSLQAIKSQDLIFKSYGGGCILNHLQKTGGTFLNVYLGELFLVDVHKKTFHRTEGDAVAQAIQNDRFSSGHLPLREIVTRNIGNQPIITILRNPLDRAKSHLRFFKAQASADFVSEFQTCDLNNPQDLDRLISLYPECCTYLSFYAPLDLDLDPLKINEETVDKCVVYTLQTCAFVGDFDHLEDTLYHLNLAMGLSLPVKDILHHKINPTPETVPPINHPDALSFLTQKLRYEFLFNERVLKGQQWKIATPLIKEPGDHRPFMIQVTLPEDFNPDLGLDQKKILSAKELWGLRRLNIEQSLASDAQLTISQHTTDSSQVLVDINFITRPWPKEVRHVLGLSEAEHWGTWSVGEYASFTFAEPLPSKFTLYLIAHTLTGTGTTPITVYVDEEETTFDLMQTSEERRLNLQNPSGTSTLGFHFPKPQSPAELGWDDDQRKLAIAFVRMKVEIPASQADVSG